MEVQHAKVRQLLWKSAVKMHAQVRRKWLTSVLITCLCVSVMCQQPSNYVYHQTIERYLKPVKQNVFWHDAKAACGNDGAILVEPKTAEYYQVLQSIYGKAVLLCYCITFCGIIHKALFSKVVNLMETNSGVAYAMKIGRT